MPIVSPRDEDSDSDVESEIHHTVYMIRLNKVNEWEALFSVDGVRGQYWEGVCMFLARVGYCDTRCRFQGTRPRSERLRDSDGQVQTQILARELRGCLPLYRTSHYTIPVAHHRQASSS